MQLPAADCNWELDIGQGRPATRSLLIEEELKLRSLKLTV